LKQYKSIDLDKYQSLFKAKKQQEEREFGQNKKFKKFKNCWNSKEADYKSNLDAFNNQTKAKKPVFY
jgi:hypothetical protein